MEKTEARSVRYSHGRFGVHGPFCGVKRPSYVSFADLGRYWQGPAACASGCAHRGACHSGEALASGRTDPLMFHPWRHPQEGKATSQSRRLLAAGLSADDGLPVAALAAALRSSRPRRAEDLEACVTGACRRSSAAKRRKTASQHKIYGKFGSEVLRRGADNGLVLSCNHRDCESRRSTRRRPANCPTQRAES